MRRVLTDTNILVPALVYPNGVASHVFWHVATTERLVLTDWILAEAREVIARKWPERRSALEVLLARLDYELVVPGNSDVVIRDSGDQPILDAAIASAVDVIVTGDKDFLSLVLDRPLIITPRQYLDLFTS